MKLAATSTHLGYGISIPLAPLGGTAPHTYAIADSGAGGSVSAQGVYTAGLRPGVDTVQVTDASGQRAYLKLYTGTAMHLLADVIQNQLGLEDGRVYIYDQKIFMPTDDGLFVALSMMMCKPFGVKTEFDPIADKEIQSCNFFATVQMDIISRSTEALTRKEEVVMALRSQYAERQQALNAFQIGSLPTGFTNLSSADGAAIPYRFSISCGLQYSQKKIVGGEFYDTFEAPEIVVNI
jgi:hypothetical protein